MTSKEESLNARIRLTRFRRTLFRILFGIEIIFFLGLGLSLFFKVGINLTDGIDGYVFLIVKGQKPERGKLVAFWPPDNNFYHDTWFVKYAMGCEGDVVVIRGDSFFIGTNYMGKIQKRASNGVPLQAAPSDVIPRGYYFVWSGHERSFDSRYRQIGLVPEDHIIGRVYVIF